MINYLKKFLNLGNYADIANEVNPISSSSPYKKLRKWSLKKQFSDIKYFLKYDLNESNLQLKYFEQAIIDNDIYLVHLLYQDLQRKKIIKDPPFGSAFLTCAKIAMKHNNKDVFEYFVEAYSSQYSNHCFYDSEFAVQQFMNHIIDKNKPDYFHILEQYGMTNFQDYFKDIIDSIGKNSKEPIEKKYFNRLSFILNNFSEKLNKDKLFLYACYGGEGGQASKDVIQLLVDNGANIYTQEGKGLMDVGKRRRVDIVEYLLNESSKKNQSNSLIDKYNGNLSYIASICAKVDYNHSVIKCFLEHGAFIDIVKYAINTDMYPWLIKYHDTKVLFNELSDELKESPQLSKPKRIKV